jgi:hypothetical protein
MVNKRRSVEIHRLSPQDLARFAESTQRAVATAL